MPPEGNDVRTHYPTISTAVIGQRFGNLGHTGIDFKLDVGSEIYSVMDGVVYKVKEDSRCYGRYISILHKDGNLSLYAHLSKNLVKEGDRVISGQLIGLSGGDSRDNIGGDGWSIRGHLHWEIRIKNHYDNNKYNIDPVKYLASFYIKGFEPDWIKEYLKYEE